MILSSCTVYGPSGYTGGYSERDLGGGRYVVWYRGNNYTDNRAVANGALRRAAEISLEKGSTRFAVLQKSSWSLQAPNPFAAQAQAAEVVFSAPPAGRQGIILESQPTIQRIKNREDVAATIADTQLGPTQNPPGSLAKKVYPPATGGSNSSMLVNHAGMVGSVLGGAPPTPATPLPSLQKGSSGELFCDVIYNAGHTWRRVEGVPLSSGQSMVNAGTDITGSLRNLGAPAKNRILRTYPAPKNPGAPRITDLGPNTPP